MCRRAFCKAIITLIFKIEYVNYKRSTRQCSGSLLLFHIKSTLSKNNTILPNTSLFMLCFYVRFGLLFQGTCRKKPDIKTVPFSSSNKETQRCNGLKSRLSKLFSLVQKQLQKYSIRDYFMSKSSNIECAFLFLYSDS